MLHAVSVPNDDELVRLLKSQEAAARVPESFAEVSLLRMARANAKVNLTI